MLTVRFWLYHGICALMASIELGTGLVYFWANEKRFQVMKAQEESR